MTELILLFLFMADPAATVMMDEDFEAGLTNWRLIGEHAIETIDSGDPDHGRVLALHSDGPVYALIRGSAHWGPVRIDAEIRFPDAHHNYVGLIYHYQQASERTDFGSIYVKGNGSYLRVNPWRDGNASRLLYEEYKTPLDGDAAIEIGAWTKIRAEIVGQTCHFYVEDMTTPKLTFSALELTSGALGFKPRIVGTTVWVDNVRVTKIDKLAYPGTPIPDIRYDPEALVTRWEVAGPYPSPNRRLERDGAATAGEWRAFDTDPRGAVVTGRVTEYAGERHTAYFRTVIERDAAGPVTLHLATLDELGLFVNGRFLGFIYRNGYLHDDWNAWWDFWRNPEHAGRRITLDLQQGRNVIMLRVRNGQFASGGLFARIEPIQ